MTVFESGPDFELRALNVARAIHDPLGLQGAVIYGGRERDAVFVSEEQIHIYEFTTLRTKDKAEHDGQKLADMVADFKAKPENAYRAVTGWFVTRDEPLPEQKAAVANAAKRKNVTVHTISVSTLQQRVCDSEQYIQCRDAAPFGSIAYAPGTVGADFRVEVEFFSDRGGSISLRDFADKVLSGERAMLTGDFGVGKSHGLRELYRVLRKEHFRRKKLTPFPLHINLRDCAGLKTPAEILRRHAEEIGFRNERSLISAWRSGACILLLDGFDEVVPVRWLGGASDLKTVRWEAMAAIRRLIEESPSGTGLVVCGRSHYFSSRPEMLEALGLNRGAETLRLMDFDDEQVRKYLDLAQSDWQVPDWIPARPLLLGYLAAMEEFSSGTGAIPAGMDRASAWRQLLAAICQREARMFNAVRPDVIQSIVARVATLARSSGSEVGPIGMDSMRKAFIDVNGRQPDEEGLQLLLRLPGLANGGSSDDDARIFVDRDLADAAYGEDLGAYLVSPHGEHPLGGIAAWVNASSELGIAVAADYLAEIQVGAKAVVAAATQRQNAGQYDAILSDTLRVASELADADLAVPRASFVVDGVIFDQLTISGADPLAATISYKNCLFQTVDLSLVEHNSDCPHFQGGMIGMLDGVAVVPEWLTTNFAGVEIEKYSSSSQTTSGIMQLSLSELDKVALTILKKIYGQRGSGRKEGALSRGLDLGVRPLVPSVLATLVSQGWVQKSTAGRNVLYVGVKERRIAALRALDSPADFRLKS